MTLAFGVATLAKAGEAGKSGPIGLAVILLLCIAAYFLFKSMSKHMRRVREGFPAKTQSTPPPQPGTAPKPPNGDKTQPPGSPEPPPAGES